MKTTGTKVSVVVPVYNVGEYLPHCLASIKGQTYSDLEIVLVDDGSTDDSGRICDEFALSDKRVRVIHQPNQGDFAARQTGLEAATGEYVYFIDGDDQIRERAIGIMVGVMEECQSDMVAFDFSYTESSQNDLTGPAETGNVEWIGADDMAYGMLAVRDLKWCVVWSKLFRRSLLEGCSFSKFYTMNDQDFNMQVYQKIEKAPFVHQTLHYYVQSRNSIQRTEKNVAKRAYFNTINRFKMLEHVPAVDDRHKKYRSWIIGHGYRLILDRRAYVKGSEYERPFASATKKIVRNTMAEFLRSRQIRFTKKTKWLLMFWFPRLWGLYAQIRYGN